MAKQPPYLCHQTSLFYNHRHYETNSFSNRSNHFELILFSSLIIIIWLAWLMNVPSSPNLMVYGAIIRTSAAKLALTIKNPSTPSPGQADLLTNVSISNSISVMNSNSNNWTVNCPCRLCETSARTGYRQIICDTGPIQHLPIYQIPYHIELIEILGAPGRENNLTLGPLFYRFPELKVLRVVYSNVPAIGQTTFRYRTSLTQLDLSHNVIENLIDASFKGLRKLEVLNLSFNRLTGIVLLKSY